MVQLIALKIGEIDMRLVVMFILMASVSLAKVDEAKIISEVALEYKLSAYETSLLFAIRKVENGGTGLEFGVAQNFPKHPARRYKNDPEKSLRCQAQWAAGSIKKRLNGNLAVFAKRYCPPNAANWKKMVEAQMLKTKVSQGVMVCQK